jgi:hypothetical protein
VLVGDADLLGGVVQQRGRGDEVGDVAFVALAQPRVVEVGPEEEPALPAVLTRPQPRVPGADPVYAGLRGGRLGVDRGGVLGGAAVTRGGRRRGIP